MIQLFFGYVEFYPLLWAISSAILYYCLLYLTENKHLFRIVVLFIIGLLIHAQLVVWFPAIIYVLLNKNKILLKVENKIRFYNTHKTLIGLTVILVLFVTSLYLLPSSKFLLPLFSGAPEAPNYYVFSLTHFADIFNLVLLVFPGFILIALLNKKIFKIEFDNLDVFLLLISTASILFLFLIYPEIGLYRDWDLLSLTLFAPLLFMCKRLDFAGIKINSNQLVIYIAFNLVIATSFIAINNHKDFSSSRYKSSLNNYDGIKFFNSWSILADFYNAEGKLEFRKILDKEIERKFPSFIESLKAQQFLFTNKLDEALVISNKLISNFPNHLNFINIHGQVFRKKRMYDSAEFYFNKGLSIQRNNFSFLFELGRIYFDQNKLEESERLLELAHTIDPLSETSNEVLSACYIKQSKFQETLELGKNILAQKPKSASGHFIMLRYYYFQNQFKAAKQHYNYFLKYGKERVDFNYVRNKYKHLIE